MKAPVIAAIIFFGLATSFHPVTPADETKYICFQIVSEPSGAQVFKSHPSEQLTTYIGITPIGLQCFSTEHLLKGSNSIHINKPGYLEWKMEIDLNGYYDSLSAAQKKPVLIQAVLKPVN